ncbi:MAG: peptidase [Firmicutes bacterium]|nr:peptidase [Bacillota bacterium]
MKRALRWVGSALTTLLLIMMIILVFFAVTSKMSQDGTSKLGNYRMMVVLSGSMSPAFETGDVILISTVKKAQYSKDDIVTFKDPEDMKKIITHRIIDVNQEGNKVSYRTKGDANNSADPKLVPANNVIGQEKLHIPYLGRMIEFGKTKQGIILLILVPGFLIIAGEFKSLIKAITEEVEKKHSEAIGEPSSKN